VDFGIRLGEKLKAGDIVAFKGGLAAGKTTMVKGIAIGLGIEDTVTSPTFPIVTEYRGRLPLYHIDLYRISGEEEIQDLGLFEILNGDGVSVVEWSEKMKIPENAIVIDMRILSAEERLIGFEGVTP